MSTNLKDSDIGGGTNQTAKMASKKQPPTGARAEKNRTKRDQPGASPAPGNPQTTKPSTVDRNEQRQRAQTLRAAALRPGTKRTPGSNDVLLGRGSGANQFWGNQQFRMLVDGYKAEYNITSKHEEKKRIAKRVYDEITARGGVFLQVQEQAKKDKESASLVEEGTWQVVDEKTAIEKCKMTLRQQVDGKKNDKQKKRHAKRMAASKKIDAPHGGGNGTQTTTTVEASNKNKANLPTPIFGSSGTNAIPTFPPAVPLAMVPTMPLMWSSMMVAGGGGGLCFPSIQGAVSQPLSMNQNIISSMSLQGAHKELEDSQRNTQEDADKVQFEDSAHSLSDSASARAISKTATIDPAQAHESTPSETEDAVFALKSLLVAGRPKFTDEDAANEQAALTNEERAKVLSDLFGTQCTLGPRPDKRARKDLDVNSIHFLLKQMKLEIDRIPTHKKQALLEIKAKGSPEELIDSRLLKFLRVEGMNAELAAQRFVTYFETRRKLFGEDKFLLPMTLDGAFRDDLLAIGTGMYCLLPRHDSSGRPILFMDPSRHTKQGYTSESMLRAFWYVLEVISQVNMDVNDAFCIVVWVKNTTVSDFDLWLMNNMTFLENNCLPVNAVSNHLCSLPLFVRKIIKPVVFAMMNKRTRARSPMHDGSESECLDTLSEYGILPSMLPSEMGGSVVLDQKEWMAQRRAVEMEEI